MENNKKKSKFLVYQSPNLEMCTVTIEESIATGSASVTPVNSGDQVQEE